MNKVLIVVDMQYDFVYGALGTPEARDIVSSVQNKVIEARQNGDTVIFTVDSHNDKEYCGTIEASYVPPHCMDNTMGDLIIPELMRYVDFYARKSTYAFNHWRENYGHDLYNANVIELCGVCTDICVISNTLALRSLYPRTPIWVDANCCAGSTPSKHLAALEVMKSCNVEVYNDN